MTTEVFSAAITYLERNGFSVIPLRPDSKQPAIEWREFQDRRATLEELNEWFAEGEANIGIVTGAISGIVVIDLDGPAGESSIQGQHEISPTRSVRTPRGRHLYFQHPGHEVRNAAGILPGVDVRGDGGFVVAPPSKIGDAAYTSNGLEKMGTLPAWLAKIRKPARAELAPDEPIPEGKRNAALTSLAGTMRRRGMGVAEITAALLVTNQTRCKPPLPDRDIHTIAASVGRYEPEERGAPSPVVVVVESSLPWTLPNEEVGVEEESIVADILYPGSKTLCISLPKVGKSTFAVGMCGAIRAGKAFLGRTVEPCNILYLTEEPRATFVATLQRAGVEEHDPGFHYLRRGMAGVAGKPWPEIVEGTAKHAADIGAELVVVDVLHRWAGFVDGGENASDKVNEAIGELTPVSEAGIAVLILAHSPWDLKRVRGSTDIFGAVDDGWFIGGEAGSSGPRTIEWIGGRHEPEQAKTAYTLTDEGRLASRGPQSIAQASRTEAVIQAVLKLEKPSPTAAIAEELDVPDRTARRWLERAQLHGFIGHDTGPHAEHLWRPRRVREWMEGKGT